MCESRTTSDAHHDTLTPEHDVSLPLVLDLDGTLIATDILAETLLIYVKSNPLRIVLVMLWLFKGRAHLKRRLAHAVVLDIERLPLRDEVVAYAQREVDAGRAAYIATASDVGVAERLKARLPFVGEVIGSDGVLNLKSAAKAATLKAKFPEGFAYVGDAAADLPVWEAAQEAIFVGGSAGVRRRLERLKGPVASIPLARLRPREWVKALRLHQWAKNSLIFVPVVLGGQTQSFAAWFACFLGFLSMGVLASATYVLNDLIDLHDDRGHWTKRHRAFASGRISIGVGLAVVPLGLIAGLGLGYLAKELPAVLMLCGYLAVTLSYSFGLKRVPVLDVVILAGLFTLRIALGAICAGVAWSPWLLVFSMFIFSSLSFAKRVTEIARLKARGGDQLSGRGYVAADEPFVLAMGVSLSSAAVFVMVMYLIQEAFHAEFYRAPQFLWTLPCILALWLGRIWLLCGRGELHDDPVVFAVRDKTSLALGGLLAASLALAVFF